MFIRARTHKNIKARRVTLHRLPCMIVNAGDYGSPYLKEFPLLHLRKGWLHTYKLALTHSLAYALIHNFGYLHLNTIHLLFLSLSVSYFSIPLCLCFCVNAPHTISHTTLRTKKRKQS